MIRWVKRVVTSATFLASARIKGVFYLRKYFLKIGQIWIFFVSLLENDKSSLAPPAPIKIKRRGGRYEEEVLCGKSCVPVKLGNIAHKQRHIHQYSFQFEKLERPEGSSKIERIQL